MEGDRWRQVDKIFHDLIEQTPEQRAAFLDHLCADDPSLKKEVEELIHAYERSAVSSILRHRLLFRAHWAM
jgi:serine/threonine-protein kinase